MVSKRKNLVPEDDAIPDDDNIKERKTRESHYRGPRKGQARDIWSSEIVGLLKYVRSEPDGIISDKYSSSYNSFVTYNFHNMGNTKYIILP